MSATSRIAWMGLLALLGAMLGAGPASADPLTPINPVGGNNIGEERCLVGVTCPAVGGAGDVYGGAQSILNILEIDLGLAPGSLVRVDDGLDTVWANLVTNGGEVRSHARYAGHDSELGYDSGSGFVPLTGVLPNDTVLVNSTASCSGSTSSDCATGLGAWVSINVAAGVPYAFILHDLTAGTFLSSNTALGGYTNSGIAADWMVTYRIPDSTPGHFIIAWEDLTNVTVGPGGVLVPNDFDYNDYVFELRFVEPIPEPGTLLLLGLGLLGVVGAARRRARRRS